MRVAELQIGVSVKAASRKTSAVLIAMGLIVPAAVADFEAHINSGGTSYVATTGITYVEDRPYVSGDFGYVGGRADGDGRNHSIEEPRDPEVESHVRVGAEAYRFDVSNDSYRVTLHFNEMDILGRGDRVFDVSIEGGVVIPALDMMAFVRHRTPIRFVFATEVQDGVLDVEFKGIAGDASIAAVSVVRVSQPVEAPPVPADFSGRDGFEMAILTWNIDERPNAARHRVFRADRPSGPYALIADIPHRSDHHFDLDVEPHRSYWYRVAGVDAFGRVSAFTDSLSVMPLDRSDAHLPVFELQMDAQDLAKVVGNPEDKTKYPAELVVDGYAFEVLARHRGYYSLMEPKRSFRIDYEDPGSFEGSEVENLVAVWRSPELINDDLAYAMFDSTEIYHARTTMANLFVNDIYYGVFSRIENPDDEFFENRGVRDIGNLYEANTRLTPRDTPEEWAAAYDRLTNGLGPMDDIIEFVEAINSASDEAFPAVLDRRLDIEKYIDFHALNVFSGNPDFITHNFLLYANPATGLWEFHPWDLSMCFFGVDRPADFGADSGNVLYSRFFQVPQFRLRYLERLEELMAGDLHESIWEPFVADLHDRIRFDGERDIWKRHTHDNFHFHRSASALVQRIRSSREFLESDIPRAASLANPVVFNEAWGFTSSPAEAPWVELHNIGFGSVTLSDYRVTDDREIPDQWTVPDTTLEAGERLLVQVGPVGTGAPGAVRRLHLFGPPQPSRLALDSLVYGATAPDSSWGRTREGWVRWASLVPSPGHDNGEVDRPRIWNVRRAPGYPNSQDEIWVTAGAGDPDGDLQSVFLHAAVDGEQRRIEGLDDGESSDLEAGDGVFGMSLLPMPNGTEVAYYLEARDSMGHSRTFPAGAPAVVEKFVVGGGRPSVRLNEILASNRSIVRDSAGEFDDWVELFNLSSEEAVDLTGFYLTDNPERPAKWKFPDGMRLAAGERILVWCDDQEEQFGIHSSFRLDSAGEYLALTDRDGVTVVDAVSFGAQFEDISYARIPDGTGLWRSANPTPGARNQSLSGPTTVNWAVGPNPFDSSAMIRLVIPWGWPVRLDIFDRRGGRIRTLLREAQSPFGEISVRWDGTNGQGDPVVSGAYVCRLEAGDETHEFWLVRLK